MVSGADYREGGAEEGTLREVMAGTLTSRPEAAIWVVALRPAQLICIAQRLVGTAILRGGGGAEGEKTWERGGRTEQACAVPQHMSCEVPYIEEEVAEHSRNMAAHQHGQTS